MITSPMFVRGPLAILALTTLLVPAGVGAQGVAISATAITVEGEPVLTEADAVPLYARGTGFFRPENRVVRLGTSVLVDDVCDGVPANRGLTLTVLEANPSHSMVSSTNYDTWNAPSEADSLAAALDGLDRTRIGILTSCDAFEANITPALRISATRLGLARLADSYPGSPATQSTWRHPYAAVFLGGASRSRQVLEVLQDNHPDAPFAVAATWLIGDGFVGQSFSPAGARRGADPGCADDSGNVWVDCGNGTVTHNFSGLVWLANANCWGGMTWQDALATVDGLADLGSANDCGLSDGSLPGDWRLPSEEEWMSMIVSAVLRSCTVPVTSDDGSTCWVEGPGSSFTGVQSLAYWSGTTVAASPTLVIGQSTAFMVTLLKQHGDIHVWPVRDGR